MKNKFLLLFLLLLHSQVFAQFYDAGQNPVKLRWKQIDTLFFKIVYPAGFEKQALKVANYLYNTNQFNTFSLRKNPIKIPIIIHNQTISSNGFVTWSPKRSEWYACPPQDLYAQPWLKQLSLHEYRHVVQVSQLNRGITRLLSIPFGQMGLGSVAGVYMPRWFVEGDAVVMETALSKSGRGRIPLFSMDLKTQLLEKGKFSYNKAMFGSYKDYVPDPYTLGYHLVANARIRYSYDIWDKTLKFTARNPFLIVPFATGFKKNTGITPKKHYENTLQYLDSMWRRENLNKIFFFFLLKTKPNRLFTDFKNPCFVNENELIAVKRSIDDICRIVKTDSSGNYKILITPGNILNDYVSYSSGKIAWAEQINDLRWGLKSTSSIKIYDLNTNKVKTIAKNKRYFSPVLSADAKKIALVEINENNECKLLVINAENADIINSFPITDNYIVTKPSWKNSNEIITTLIGDSGKTFIKFNLLTTKSEKLIPFTFTDISNPVFVNDLLCFNSEYNGVNEILALDIASNEFFSLTTSRYAASNFCFSDDRKKIYYSNYTANGYQLVETEFKIKKLFNFNLNSQLNYLYVDELNNQEKNAADSILNKEIYFKSVNYKKITNLINIHSWAPFSIDANNQSIAPGVSVMSHNLLSTAFITLGYEYLTAYKRGKYYLNFIYKGWYPVIEAKIDYSNRNGKLVDKNDVIISSFTFGETNLKTTIRLPLKFNTGKYFSGIQPSLSTTIINISHHSLTPSNFKKGNINTIDYRLYAYHNLRMSQRDLLPKWGQSLEFNYRHSPFGINNYGNIFAVENYLYFPSLLRQHGFVVYNAFQSRNINNPIYEYADLISYPIGNYSVNSNKLYSFSVKYYFPLMYPDFSVSSLMYLKRLDMSLYYGNAIATYNSNQKYLSSVGSEINSEMHIMRFVAPVNLGYRLMFLPENKSFYHEILFAVNFSAIGNR